MTTLQMAPYNLRSGDAILYRVRSRNVVGTGAWTPMQQYPVIMDEKPGHVKKPKLDNFSKDGFRVCWENNEVSFKYSLYWNEGATGLNFRKLIGPVQERCYTFTKIHRTLIHKIYIQAENECGKRSSKVVEAPTASLPSMPVLRVTEKQCKLYLAW